MAIQPEYLIQIYGGFFPFDSIFNNEKLKVCSFQENGTFNKIGVIADTDYISYSHIHNSLIDLLNITLLIKNSLFSSNNDIVVNAHILIAYKNQCNYELSIEEINLMNQIGCSLSITCYESDEFEK